MCPDGTLQTVALHEDTKPPLTNRSVVLAVADAGGCDSARLEQPTVCVLVIESGTAFGRVNNR